MSAAACSRRLRRNECFLAATTFLDERGIGFRVGRGSKHPFIVVEAPGDSFRLSFPGSAGDHRSALNTVRDLKRRLAGNPIGAAPC